MLDKREYCLNNRITKSKFETNERMPFNCGDISLEDERLKSLKNRLEECIKMPVYAIALNSVPTIVPSQLGNRFNINLALEKDWSVNYDFSYINYQDLSWNNAYIRLVIIEELTKLGWGK